MSPELTVMGGELGNIFWDLPPWIVYAPGYDLGCTIYVANPTDTVKEYSLISRLSTDDKLISEEAVKVFGYAWFKVDPQDFIKLRGALGTNESNAVLSVLLIERETEEVADSVATSLVAPSVSSLPPSWPGTPGTTGTTSFDWSSMLMMAFPLIMLGMMIPAARPQERKKEVGDVARKEERKQLTSGRQE